MCTINDSFIERITQLRTARFWSKTYVAQRIGVASNTYSNWEYGKREPGFESVVKLADLYNVSVDYLLGRVQQQASELNIGEYQFLRDLEMGISFEILMNKYNLILDGSPVPQDILLRHVNYIRAERTMVAAQ